MEALFLDLPMRHDGGCVFSFMKAI